MKPGLQKKKKGTGGSCSTPGAGSQVNDDGSGHFHHCHNPAVVAQRRTAALHDVAHVQAHVQAHTHLARSVQATALGNIPSEDLLELRVQTADTQFLKVEVALLEERLGHHVPLPRDTQLLRRGLEHHLRE